VRRVVRERTREREGEREREGGKDGKWEKITQSQHDSTKNAEKALQQF
jgi:hypothetical protein